MSFIKLQTNIPLVGIVKYVDHKKTDTEGWSDQISMNGNWDGFGEQRVYLPLGISKDMFETGLCGPRVANGDAYPLLLKDAKVKILRTEENNKKRTTLEVLSHAGGAPPARTQANYQSTPASNTTAAQPVSAESKKEKWESMLFTMEGCIKAAKKLCVNEESVLGHTVATVAASIFAQCGAMGLWWKKPGATAEPAAEVKKVTDVQMGVIANHCVRVNQGEVWLSSYQTGIGMPAATSALTFDQATHLIAKLAEMPTPARKEEEIPF